MSEAANTGPHDNRARYRYVLPRVAGTVAFAVAGSLIITVAITFMLGPGTWPDRVAITIAILAPALISSVAGYFYLSMAYQLRETNEQLLMLSETDPLTGVLNRRKFVEIATRELSLARRHTFPTSLVLLDLDHFKRVNDEFGHAVGDQALIHAVNQIQAALRATDVVARFGGEEFILLLPHTASEGARTLANRIIESIFAHPLDLEERSVQISASAGIVTCETSETPLDMMLSTADQLLYASKSQGRNRSTAETFVSLVA